jgi:NDP-sugar pyrophosphorylase family protein
MALQAEADPSATIAQWHRALAVDGFLMFSTLGPGSLPELRSLYATQSWGSPMAPLVDMHDLGDMLVAAEISTPVVLMAGGKGVRLFPLTKDVPKPMLKIGDQPIIEIILRKLHAQGFRNIYISVNYLADVIRDHVKDGAWLGLKVSYLEETQPLGTAGALAQLAGTIGEPFVVMNSDLLTNCDLRQVLKFHKKQVAAATLGVREYSFQVPYGVVNIDGNEVESISEKPVHRSMVSAGIYVLGPSALDLIPKDEFCDMPTLLDSVKAQGQKVVAFPIHESWLDIGRHDDLNEARNNLDHWLNF